MSPLRVKLRERSNTERGRKRGRGGKGEREREGGVKGERGKQSYEVWEPFLGSPWRTHQRELWASVQRQFWQWPVKTKTLWLAQPRLKDPSPCCENGHQYRSGLSSLISDVNFIMTLIRAIAVWTNTAALCKVVAYNRFPSKAECLVFLMSRL